MGLQSTVENAVVIAFDASGDLIGLFNLIRRSNIKNTATNTTVTNEITVSGIQGIFDEISDGDFGNKNIESGDRVLYLKPDISWSVKADDRIIDPNGVEWRVKAATGVAPSGKMLLHKLHVTS